MSESEDKKIEEEGGSFKLPPEIEEEERAKAAIESIRDVVRGWGYSLSVVKSVVKSAANPVRCMVFSFRRMGVLNVPTYIPTQDEVFVIMKEFIKGREHSIKRERRDEKGLYLWDIVVPGEDGGTVEYSYARKGRYPETKVRTTAIHRTFYDRDGFPETGDSVAKFVKGKWRVTF